MKTATLVLLLAVVAGSMAQDYCSLCSGHTMCKYRSPGPRCSRILKSGLNSAERNQVVAAHNEVRARVAAGQEGAGSNGGQPPAANMRKMVWDNELAAIAQRWSDQCNFGHDSCRNVARFYVGQNAFMSGSWGRPEVVDWREVVKSWYSEVKDFDRNDISPYRSTNLAMVGHYTQVVWAASTRVGCGLTQFPDGQWTRSLIICNYGPGGNFGGQSIYIPGPACSRCPGGTSCQNSLCA